MKSVTLPSSIVTAALLAVLLAFANPVMAAGEEHGYGSNKARGFAFLRLGGTYDASIDFFGNPVRALYSFHAGGTLTEADNPGFDPNFGGFAISPGLGSWERTGRNEYSAVYRKLAYDTAGQLAEVFTTTMTLALRKDGSLVGTISVVATLPDGTVVAEFNDLPLTATSLMVQ